MDETYQKPGKKDEVDQEDSSSLGASLRSEAISILSSIRTILNPSGP